MSSLVRYTVMLATALLTVDTALAVEKASSPPGSTNTKDAVAAGSLDDSLQTGLARIPKDATSGQRMLAEQSCRGDEADHMLFEDFQAAHHSLKPRRT